MAGNRNCALATTHANPGRSSADLGHRTQSVPVRGYGEHRWSRAQRSRQGRQGRRRERRKALDQFAPDLAFAGRHQLPALSTLQELLTLGKAQTRKLLEGSNALVTLIGGQIV